MIDMVQLIRWVAECDAVNVDEPMTREQALERLKAMSENDRHRHDLVDVASGRLVSWVIR